jgi:hypothetical protein
MVSLFATTTSMLRAGIFYQTMFVAQTIFLSLALFGGRLKNGFMRLPYMFTLLHVASVFGFFKYLSGNIYTTWIPRNN